MYRTLISAALLWGAAGTSFALPLVQAQFTTDTTAVAEGNADADSGLAPEGSSPLVSSVTVVGKVDFASSSGIAALGLFDTTAEAFSASSFASGVGVAAYTGIVSGADGVMLHFALATQSGLQQSGYALTSLAIRVESGGTTVFDRLITSDGVYDYRVALPSSISTLRFELASQASTLTGGSANASGVLSYAVTAVPEPHPLALAAVGALLLAGRRFRAIARMT